LGEHELDDLKEQAVSLKDAAAGPAKKPKLTHKLFFDDDKGLKKVIKDFPLIRFKGKGHEFDDLKVLMGSYRKWFKELYPFEDDFEDMIWKSRKCLQEKDKSEEGLETDAHEQLHQLRFDYKQNGGLGTKGAADAAYAAARATLEKATAKPQLSEEAKQRIEANRQKALEIKRKRQAEQLRAMEEMEAEAEPAGPTCLDEDEDDVFGFGGGLDDEDGPASTRKAPPPTFMDEEEDVFGFGGGLDDEPGAPPAPPVPPAPPAPAIDPEVAKKVAANRAAALERKRKRQEEAAAEIPQVPAPTVPDSVQSEKSQGTAPTAPDLSMDVEVMEDPDDDPFGFGGGLD